MTYDQWKTDSGYAEKTPEQENEGRDCPHNCYRPGDCDGSCTHPQPIASSPPNEDEPTCTAKSQK